MKNSQRYDTVTQEKSGGIVYTPDLLANFVAEKILDNVTFANSKSDIRILDPAVGHGDLILSLLRSLNKDHPHQSIALYGFDTDPTAIETAKARIEKEFPETAIHFHFRNFLDFALNCDKSNHCEDLTEKHLPNTYHLIIANPPYVRTQILGAKKTELLRKQFGLSGRIDLYYAFILGIAKVIDSNGTAGLIVSNRFMTTKSGACVRQCIFDRFTVQHAWDFGDTKLFDASVLPAVLILHGKKRQIKTEPAFTSIYETSDESDRHATDPVNALSYEGAVKVKDGRKFFVQHGTLNTSGQYNGIWRVATTSSNNWLKSVHASRWKTFGEIGKIRVGVKTCADQVFIRDDWHNMPSMKIPELLKPLITHQVARRFKPILAEKPKFILYPHEVVDGHRQAVNLSNYPYSQSYLLSNKSRLKKRKYLTKAGREWYEIWVPQDPQSWRLPKLVFRDISKEPTFWIDLDSSVVNGDCYWLVARNEAHEELLWLALAVANSTFIEQYYDVCFQNKLYSGRRRFMTQYVEQFPLPDPNRSISKAIIQKSKLIYRLISQSSTTSLQKKLNSLVWEAFTESTENH